MKLWCFRDACITYMAVCMRNFMISNGHLPTFRTDRKVGIGQKEHSCNNQPGHYGPRGSNTILPHSIHRPSSTCGPHEPIQLPLLCVFYGEHSMPTMGGRLRGGILGGNG